MTIIEIFDCGHGHRSQHNHEVCQICKIGKPEKQYQEESIDGKIVLKLIERARALID